VHSYQHRPTCSSSYTLLVRQFLHLACLFESSFHLFFSLTCLTYRRSRNCLRFLLIQYNLCKFFSTVKTCSLCTPYMLSRVSVSREQQWIWKPFEELLKTNLSFHIFIGRGYCKYFIIMKVNGKIPDTAFFHWIINQIDYNSEKIKKNFLRFIKLIPLTLYWYLTEIRLLSNTSTVCKRSYSIQIFLYFILLNS
jgi:hypothetical protein